LKSLGWGVEKGIPDAILTGSALSDVLLITSSGSVPEEIVQTAQAYGVAEIIIGKRGHRPLEDVLVRSVSQAVLETSPLPVLVVAADANALMTR
ncbi:MAG: universal stress protein, partial [Leptodesmis sp.]|uniref:universal stress protein n=1 Tax=Leptodesmis sp. TaxID=3100501 RepID=UPI003D0E42A3